MEKSIWLDFTSPTNDVVRDIVAHNETFDACTIRVMYTGENRNRTSISKSAVEAALHTLAYCPIVCHYITEEDRIGGHDVAFVKTPDGAVRMVNMTDPIGVIPAWSNCRWETYQDGDNVHEYLVVDGLLWKRSAAYDKVKRDGVSGQSMEITVKRGESVDGIFQIYDFLFTAFCILGEDVEPCFESAALETFSLGDYKERFEHMMDDLKLEPSVMAAAPEGDDRTFSLKGGEGKVNLDEMMAKYGLTSEDISFDTEGMEQEEIEKRFSEIRDAKFADEDPNSQETPEEPAEDAGDAESGESAYDPNTDEEDDASGEPTVKREQENSFSLMAGQLEQELRSALRAEKYHDEYWDEDMPRYWMIDFDAEAQMVYVEDGMNGVLAGFSYTMNGDTPVIDFSSYKRKKIEFVDFDEGEQTIGLFSEVMEEVKPMFEKRMEAATSDMEELRKFHDEVIAEERKAKLAEVFASFEDLAGNESFEALKENCADMSIEDISEKCFAIRGRNMKVNFSMNAQNQSSAVRLPIERNTPVDDNEPYHGIFAKYGFGR